MKIGIMTLSAADNCGSLLQTYALQRYVEDTFQADVDIISFINDASKDAYDIFPGNWWKHPRYSVFKLCHYGIIRRHKDGYAKFRKNFLHMTPEIYRNVEDLKQLHGYDYLIAGSDQIWNVKMSDYDDAFFLPWKTDAKKISYAASMGSTFRLPAEKVGEVKTWLQDFKAISVREKEDLPQMREIAGGNVQLSADPTLIADPKIWDELAGDCKINQEYIFYYSWAYCDQEMNELVQRFAKEKNMPVYVINAWRWSRHRPEYYGFQLSHDSGPQVFLNLMKYARYVFVQSFHGAVFANILKKDYFFLNERSDGVVDFRSDNLLTLCNQKCRVVHCWTDLEKSNLIPLSYNSACVEELIEGSKEFLRYALKNVEH